MKAEKLIVEALEHARSLGVPIRRGAVFDWRDPTDPFKHIRPPASCNALGAVLLTLGREQLAEGGFDPEWLQVVRKHLDVDGFWVWRFINGFDYGNVLTFTYTKNGEDIETKDDVSQLGDRLAKKYAG